MQITVLMDNCVYGKKLTAEHGLSLLIDNGKKILFDTAQSNHFINNASVLGLDLKDVTAAVISHGHYDHTGGLTEFLSVNKSAPVYIKKEAFYYKTKDKTACIGMNTAYDDYKNRFNLSINKAKIAEDVFIITDIPVINSENTSFNHFFVEEDDHFVPDQFLDEQILLIKYKDSLVLLNGCSHRGITNAIKAAENQLNLPVETVVGGFHLLHEDRKHIDFVIEQLKKSNVRTVYTSHCTGFEAYSLLKEKLSIKVDYTFTGKIIQL